MSNLASLFSGVNFQSTIQRYASQNGWRIAEINNRKAVFNFNMDSRRTQILYIIRYESTLEFSVPSAASFNSEDAVPHYLSTLLLKRNSQRKVGFWCIEEIGNKHVFSCMHNAEMQLIDSNYFAQVVKALVIECDNFEDILVQLIG